MRCASHLQELSNASFSERVDRKGHRHQPNVEREALTGDVAPIEARRPMAGAQADHLREAGQARKHSPTKIVARAVPAESPDVRLGERPRADGTHLAAQDVEELREQVPSRIAGSSASAGSLCTHRWWTSAAMVMLKNKTAVPLNRMESLWS